MPGVAILEGVTDIGRSAHRRTRRNHTSLALIDNGEVEFFELNYGFNASPGSYMNFDHALYWPVTDASARKLRDAFNALRYRGWPHPNLQFNYDPLPPAQSMDGFDKHVRGLMLGPENRIDINCYTAAAYCVLWACAPSPFVNLGAMQTSVHLSAAIDHLAGEKKNWQVFGNGAIFSNTQTTVHWDALIDGLSPYLRAAPHQIGAKMVARP